MKSMINNKKKYVLFFLVVILLFVAACSPQVEATPAPTAEPVEVTRIVEKTVMVTEVVYQVITATDEPNTPTTPATFTSTPVPELSPTIDEIVETVTLTPDLSSELEVTDDGFSVWCAKYPGQIIDEAEPWNPPYDVHAGATIQDFTQVVFPNEFCVFVFQLGKTIDEGTNLAVYEIGQQSPWLTAELVPAKGNSGVYYAVMNHPYIVNPPLWFVSYQFKLVDSNQAEQWSRTIEFTRGWLPKQRCWDGAWPDPITLECSTPPEWEPIHTGYWEYKQTVDAIDKNK